MATESRLPPRASGDTGQQEAGSLPQDDSRQRGLRILLIDDSRDMAEAMRIVLEQFGHQVRTASTALAGMEAARQFQPEVVLCDLGLPEIDGYFVAAMLRRDPAMAGTRLIALSGYVHEADRRRAREVGFDLHITKPVDPDELQRLLTQAVTSPS